MFRRKRFADVITRQLDLFERDERALIEQCETAERAYDRAERTEAEERYGDYADLVESGTEILADIRDHFARTLDDETAEEYTAAFNGAVAKRLPRFALEIENR
jgi:isocitrate dehydrogenase kinase/phosphatase